MVVRFMFIAGAMYYLGKFKTSDRFYTPLPLYHTAGGIVCVGQVLLQGATCVIRKKFSASAYFDDCRKYNCTVCILFIFFYADKKNNLIKNKKFLSLFVKKFFLN